MGIPGPPARGWRGARSAVRAALAVAMLCWAAFASAQERGPQEIGLAIVAGEDWTATGIEVRPGDTIAIVATNAFTPQAPISPDGMPDSTTDNVVEPKLPHAALIGRVGEGPIFLVGRRYEEKMIATGPLRLRWNLLRGPHANQAPQAFPVEIRHTPAPDPVPDPDPDPDEDKGKSTATDTNSIAENVSVETAPVETRPPPRRPRAPGRAQRDVPPSPAPSLFSAMGSWLLWLLILLVAVGAALAFQQGARARTVKRTRAMLGVSPSLDLAEGDCRGDDLPAEGPAASLRSRLEPGAARMEEGSEHG